MLITASRGCNTTRKHREHGQYWENRTSLLLQNMRPLVTSVFWRFADLRNLIVV
jgi:hypothetical protein